MPKKLLQEHEIEEAVVALREAFSAIRRIRDSRPQGTLVQFPKIPPILSESIVALEIRSGRGPIWKSPAEVTRGGAKADLLVSSTGRSYRIEVKGTGRQGFQFLGPKDVKADVLVWVDFGGFFEKDARNPITAYWLPKPNRVFPRPAKISLGAFRKRGGNNLMVHAIRISPSSQRQSRLA